MLTLGGTVLETNVSKCDGERQLLSLSTNPDLPMPLRRQKAFLVSDDDELPLGFRHYIAFKVKPERLPKEAVYTILGNEFGYLGDNDVVALGNGRIRSLF